MFKMLNEVRNRGMLVYLLLLTLGIAIGFQGWSTMLINFSVEEVGLDAAQNGLVQSVRELPGLLTVGAVVLLLFIKERNLVFGAAVVSALGVMATGHFPTLTGVICTALVASFGFHYFEGVSQSLTLQHFSKAEAPIVMSRLRSFTAMGNFIIGIVIFGVSGFFPYKINYYIVGLLALVPVLFALRFKPQEDASLPVQRSGVVFKKRYWLFYLLTLLSGARRQIFMVFSVLLLVKNYGFSVRDMALLFIFNNLINWFLNPIVGRMINRVGERKMLSVKYVCLASIFMAYTITGSAWVVGGLYIVEQFFFNFTINLRTYFQKIADPLDIAPTMALGVTINHIAAVIVPLVGGLLWMYDFRLPFWMGIGFAAASLIMTQFIVIPKADEA